MRATGVVRRVLWCGCLAAVMLSGCARLIGKTASKDRGPLDAEASFAATSVGKPLPQPKATAPQITPATPAATAPVASTTTAPAALAQPAGVSPAKTTATLGGSAIDTAAIKADTLARLKTLPDVTKEQYAEYERTLSTSDDPVAAMYLRQLHGLVISRQEQAGIIPRATTAPAPVREQVAKEPVAAPSKVAASVAPQLEASEPPAVETQETEVVTPVVVTPRSLADRLRQSKDSATTTTKEPGIFGGKVKTGSPAPPAEDEEAAPQTHTANKPATAEDAEEAEPESPAQSSASPSSWNESLDAAIVALEREVKSEELPAADRQQREASLRILYLLAQRKDDALSEIEGLEPAQQDYWRSQLHSLQISLASDGTPVPGRRAAQALRPLREAADQLGALATLDVQHLALCSQVTMWGNYQEFSKYEFKPDQEVLLYFEVENFTALDTNDGFATEFVSSYEIFDAAGRRVAEQQFPVASETCRNRRRDYFIRYHMHVPKQLAAGEYTLQLTVEDQKGHKFGQGSLKFKVL